MPVKIYTTPTCHYCHMAKEYFREHKVKFEEIDVSRDEKARNEMIEKSGSMGVPVIEINGKMIIGFNRGEIERALKNK